MDSAALDCFASRGIDRCDAERLVLSCKDQILLNRVAVSGAFADVTSPYVFVKALPVLKTNVYEKKEYGEDVECLYSVRKKVAGCIDALNLPAEVAPNAAAAVTPNTETAPVVAPNATVVATAAPVVATAAIAAPNTDAAHVAVPVAPGRDAAEYTFAAWALWQKNKSKMYLPCNVVFAYCYRWKLDSKEMLKHLRRHDVSKNMVTTNDLYECERTIDAFLRKATACAKLTCKSSDALDAVQNRAVRLSLASPVSAIQGGAGVGKTTTVSHLVNEVASQTSVVCLAFTHKAKRCIRQKLQNDDVRVSTIHSFIQTHKGAAVTQYERLFLLLDETSMIDVELLADLAKTVMQKCDGYQVCFVGDEQQLQPIGRGEFFRCAALFLKKQEGAICLRGHDVHARRSLVGASGGHVSVLKKCYRTDRPDMFGAYQRIREGEMPESSPNFDVKYCETDKDINARVGAVIRSMADGDAVQFIAWQNKDVYKVNQWVQARLLKTGRVGPESWGGFYKGDKVIYRGDNTKDGVTNATIGRVTDVNRSIKVLWEDGKISTFFKDVAKDLFLAYCITAHSSQGSEYATVVVPCYDVDKMMKCIDRRWFYTAVTRARSHVTVMCSPGIKEFLRKDIAPQPVSGVHV